MRVDVGARRLAALATAGLVWCLGCAEDPSPNTDVAEIFLLSALPGQIGSIADIADGALEHRRSQLSADQFAVAQRVVRERFSPEALEEQVLRRLGAEPWSEHMEQALAQLRTPLCGRVVREQVAFYEPSAQHEAQAFFERNQQAPPSPMRLALIERYDTAANSADVASQTVLLATLSGAVILDALKSPDERAGPAALLETVDSSRKLLHPIFKKTSAMTSLFVFKDLTDEDLEDFLVFSESKAGRWYHRATSDALLESLREISLGIGNVYIAALDERPSS